MTHNYACKRLSQVTTNSNWKLKLAIDDFFFSFGRSLSATVAAAAALPATCSVACHDCNLDIGLWRVWKLTCALHFLWTLSAKLLTSPVQTTASQFQSTEPDGKNAIFPWLHTTLQIHTAACAFVAAAPLGRRAPNAATRAKKNPARWLSWWLCTWKDFA